MWFIAPRTGVQIGSEFIPLSPMRARVLMLLYNNLGYTVPRTALHPDANARKVHICFLRSALAQHATITAENDGYTLRIK